MVNQARLVRSKMVGRREDLARLERSFADVATGLGKTTVILGEAGIGKSRLIAEFGQSVRQHGGWFGIGRCFDGEQGVPYGPIREILLEIAIGSDGSLLRQTAEPYIDDLFRIVPELLTELNLSRPDYVSNPIKDQYFGYWLLSRMLQASGRNRASVIIIEDVQWADDATLGFLQYFARTLPNLPILLLLTMRDGEERSRFVDDLYRTRTADFVQLKGLDARQVGALTRSLLSMPDAPSPAFSDAIHAITHGNPFYVEEVLSALIESGTVFSADASWKRLPLDQLRVPGSLRATIAQRLVGLSATELRVARMAAVIGEDIPADLLRRVLEVEEESLLAPLGVMLDRAILVETHAHGFKFRHAMIRRAVLDGMLKRERQLAHRRVRDTLLTITGADQDVIVGDLAFHSFQAGDWERTFHFGELAGQQAMQMNAPQLAIEHIDRVTVSADHLGRALPVELLLLRARAAETTGDFARSRTDFETVVARAQASGNERLAWEAMIGIGFLWTAVDTGQARRWLTKALRLARQMGDPGFLAHSLNRLGNWLANNDQTAEAIAHHLEALEIVTTLSDRQAEAETRDLLGMAHSLDGNLVAAQHEMQQAAALFRQSNDSRGLAGTFLMDEAPPGPFYDSLPLVVHGHVLAAAQRSVDALELAKSIGWKAGEAFLLILTGEYWGTAGDFGEANEMITAGYELAVALGHIEWQIQGMWALGWLSIDLGDAQRAIDWMQQGLYLASEFRAPFWEHMCAGALASMMAMAGDPEGAEEILRPWLPPDLGYRTTSQRFRWSGAIDICLARGEFYRALALVDTMIMNSAYPGKHADIPWLALRKCMSLRNLHRSSEAAEMLEWALATARHQGMRIIELRLLIERLWTNVNEPETMDEVKAIIAAIAKSIPGQEQRDRFVSSILSTLPSTQSTDGLSLLSVRERDVAHRLALGQSNREIAEALFLSERTIEAHVSHVLRKLGFTNRTQVAAWIARDRV